MVTFYTHVPFLLVGWEGNRGSKGGKKGRGVEDSGVHVVRVAGQDKAEAGRIK